MSRFFSHPLWLVGFRPFFLLACIAGLLFPALWVSLYSGWLGWPDGLPPLQWHAHEMFFGFGWALLAGFLLTASKNWVGVRGWHGGSLAFLVLTWLLERLAMAGGAAWPRALFLVAAFLFLFSVVSMILATLLGNRKHDSFRNDNLFLVVALPLFLPAKYLLLSPEHFNEGWGMTLGLFRLAFLIVFERTLTQFMGVLFRVDILRDPRLDLSIKFLGLVLVFASFLPGALAAWLSLLLCALLLLRFAFWKPRQGMRRLDVGIMYVGYLALALQLLLAWADALYHPAWVGSVSVHVFTLGVMGAVAPAMIVRLANGHTGRKVVFELADKAALWLMLLGLGFRVLAPQFLPAGYVLWLVLAAVCWFGCFGSLAWRYAPILMSPRADGREH